MLVLSRKPDERIVFDEVFDRNGNPVELEVAVLEFRKGKVRLGVTAPRHIPVHRDEVQKAIERSRAQ